MERFRKPKPAGVFVGRKFWLDGKSIDVDKFCELSNKIVVDSMVVNDCQTSIDGRVEYLNKWKSWYQSENGNLDGFFDKVPQYLYSERVVWIDSKEKPLSQRSKKHVIFGIKKILENFNAL